MEISNNGGENMAELELDEDLEPYDEETDWNPSKDIDEYEDE